MYDPARFVIALTIVLFGVTLQGGRQAMQAVIELVEVKGMDAPPEKVLAKEVRKVGSNEPFTYKYERPNGHRYSLVFKMQDAGSTKKGSHLVKLSITWRDETDNKLEKQIDDLAIDGSFSMSLYATDRPGTEVALRLTPTVLR